MISYKLCKQQKWGQFIHFIQMLAKDLFSQWAQSAATLLFSASEQTHFTLVVCNSEWVTVALHCVSEYPPKWFPALFGCYMAGITWNCCHLSATSVYTIQPCTSLQCHFIQSHIHKMQVCLAVTCHCTFYRMIRICYVLPQQHGVGMDTEIRVSTEIWSWKKIILLPLLTWTQDLLITSRSLYHWAVPTPNPSCNATN